MSALLKQIADSKKTVLERFKKLYRTLYFQFLQFDFMHKKDLLKAIADLNARIDATEKAMNAGFKAIDASVTASVTGHTHPSPQAPGGTLVTGPGIASAPSVPTPPVDTSALGQNINTMAKAESQNKSRASELLSQGPATAPLSEVFSPEQLAANTVGQTNVLVGG